MEVTDKENKKNYRPISDLQFVGKLIETIVNNRLNKHMTDNNLLPDFQHSHKKVYTQQRPCY